MGRAVEGLAFAELDSNVSWVGYWPTLDWAR
jgi:hypothetical protein